MTALFYSLKKLNFPSIVKGWVVAAAQLRAWCGGRIAVRGASASVLISGNAADFFNKARWMILFPGIAVSLAVFAFNLFDDSLRDDLDPRLKV